MASRRRAEGRAAGAFTLRGWTIVAGGAVTAAVVLTAWLPVGALLTQRAALSSASGRLAQLSQEGRSLAVATTRLGTSQAVDQLAREQYQLVEPGQRLVQVLPPTFTPSGRASEAPYPGDPGFAPIVDPDGTTAASTVGSGTVGSVPTSSIAPSAPASHGTSPGFVSRVLTTLEFWR